MRGARRFFQVIAAMAAAGCSLDPWVSPRVAATCPSDAAACAMTSASPAWNALAAGSRFTCALVEGGRARCWGDDINVVPLLTPGMTDPSVPREVSLGLMSGEAAVAISGSYDHVCVAVKRLPGADTAIPPSRILCWGEGDDGQLGSVPARDSHTPLAVEGLPELAVVRSLSAGNGFTCAAFENEPRVFCWGAHDAQPASALTVGMHRAITLPNAPGTSRPQLPLHVAAGYSNACALAATGRVYCWGSNESAQLGNGAPERLDVAAPMTPVSTAQGEVTDAVAVAIGGVDDTADRFACLLRRSGQVLCWGDDQEGQSAGRLVEPDMTGAERVRQAERVTPIGANFTRLSLGDAHGCALRDNGDVWCWGLARNAQTGRDPAGDTVDARTVASRLMGPSAHLAAGQHHTCSATRSASGLAAAVQCFGSNANSQLGASPLTTQMSATPVLVP